MGDAIVSLGHYILDDAGDPRPATLLEWARWFETAERHLAFDDLGAAGLVSTVFLGLDHNWYGGPPILWETMIFGGPLDGDMERYTSRAAAIEGARQFCGLVQDGSIIDLKFNLHSLHSCFGLRVRHKVLKFKQAMGWKTRSNCDR